MSLLVDWIKGNYGWLLSLIIQGFIAYHVFFLTKRLSTKARLEHKEIIKQKAEELLAKIHSGKLSSDVYLVNTSRYYKDYPSNKEKRFGGYSHIKAGLKITRFDGVEFFSEMPRTVYKKENGELSFKGNKQSKVFNVYPVGVVPYDWIEHLDPQGDEYGGLPLFYCHFKGKTNWNFWKRLLFFGYPYKETLFYKLSGTYEKRNDPYDMKYEYVSGKISTT